MKFELFTKFVTKQTYISSKLSLLARSILYFRFILDNKWRKSFDIKRFIAINKLPNNPLKSSELDTPAIHLLLVTKSQDIHLLEVVITQALKNSLNPITAIIIIVPNIEVNHVSKLLKGNFFSDLLSISGEDFVIPEKVRNQIKLEFGNLYGWILQQLLKIWSVANSNAQGVLVLDADTILLSPKLFLDKFETQILQPSFEFHLPYYEFLNNFKPHFGKFDNSFISHHMLMQPKYAAEAFRRISSTLDDFAQEICSKYDKREINPICIEFELYAQFMITNFRSKVVLSKWSNLSVKRSKILDENGNYNFSSYVNKFNSISVHSWM